MYGEYRPSVVLVPFNGLIVETQRKSCAVTKSAVAVGMGCSGSLDGISRWRRGRLSGGEMGVAASAGGVG